VACSNCVLAISTTFGRVAEDTLGKLARSKTGEVLSWCPSWQVQFTEMTLPTVEKARGAKPFDMTPFTLFLRRHLDRMRPLLRERVPMHIALRRHPGVHGVVEAAEEILCAVPGIDVVDLQQPAVGLQANNLRVLPQYRRTLQEQELLDPGRLPRLGRAARPRRRGSAPGDQGDAR
jgi:hypothetical protein